MPSDKGGLDIEESSLEKSGNNICWRLRAHHFSAGPSQKDVLCRVYFRCVYLRPYYTMRWVCVLVTGTENAIEKDPNASLKHSHWLYYTGFCSRFACVLLAVGHGGSLWVKTRDKVQNVSETTYSVIRHFFVPLTCFFLKLFQADGILYRILNYYCYKNCYYFNYCYKNYIFKM